MYTERFNSIKIKELKALVDTEFTGYLIFLYNSSPLKSSKADKRKIELFNNIIDDMKESLKVFRESRCRKEAETTDVSYPPQVMRFYID